jgi:two-component system chemotaxis response regulator CheY
MKRILVVDDDAASCETATLILQQEFECAVETAADGAAALDSLSHTLPDAVLVSLNLPAMSGGAFMQACQQDLRCRGVPILVLGVTPLAAVDAIRLGARGFIRKPIDAGGVMGTLHHVLWGAETQPAHEDGAGVRRAIASRVTIGCTRAPWRDLRARQQKASRGPRPAMKKGAER